MTTRQIVPAVFTLFIAWRVYSRVRRNIGRQRLQPTRLKVSVGIFSVVTLLFAVAGLTHPLVLAALAGGLAVSVPVAHYGLKLTKFEDTPEGKFYTPNTALGVGISMLFLGRIVYRVFMATNQADLSVPASPAMMQSPLTFFLFGLSAGYFIAYQSGVLIRSHKPAA
jgi:hypothetical protein